MPMAATRLSDAQKQEIVERYRQGETSTALAVAYGCSANTVSRVLKAALAPDDYERLKQQRGRAARAVTATAAPVGAPSDAPLDAGTAAAVGIAVAPVAVQAAAEDAVAQGEADETVPQANASGDEPAQGQADQDQTAADGAAEDATAEDATAEDEAGEDAAAEDDDGPGVLAMTPTTSVMTRPTPVLKWMATTATMTMPSLRRGPRTRRRGSWCSARP